MLNADNIPCLVSSRPIYWFAQCKQHHPYHLSMELYWFFSRRKIIFVWRGVIVGKILQMAPNNMYVNSTKHQCIISFNGIRKKAKSWRRRQGQGRGAFSAMLKRSDFILRMASWFQKLFIFSLIAWHKVQTIKGGLIVINCIGVSCVTHTENKNIFYCSSIKEIQGRFPQIWTEQKKWWKI